MINFSSFNKLQYKMSGKVISKAPKLLDLCAITIIDDLLQGDENDVILSVIPSQLIPCFLPHMPPLALHKLHLHLKDDQSDEYKLANDHSKSSRKRKRSGILDTTWYALYQVRWPSTDQVREKWVDAWLKKGNKGKDDSVVDWQQKYWETHLQDCVDAVAETALLPSYNGSIGEIRIPDAILEIIGCKSHPCNLTSSYLKFSYHCQQFGIYARYLRLPNVLYVAETCHLLQHSKLESLELHWIKSQDHIKELCELLRQNTETLRAIEFIHCKLSPKFINAICDALYLDGLQTHGIEHFSIERSNFLQAHSSTIPLKLESFLRTGRSLCSVKFCDDHLGRSFAKKALYASDSVSSLDLSENDISGFLLEPQLSTNPRPTWSLRELSLRGCNLVKQEMTAVRLAALSHMPNLEKLDLSDNSIQDGVSSLVEYFRGILTRDLPFRELKLENCELPCYTTAEILSVLSIMKTPLNFFSIKGNNGLGSRIVRGLGKFICTGVRALDIEDIGLGSSGFKELLELMASTSLKAILQPECLQDGRGFNLVYINISNNKGGIEAANFVTKLISDFQDIVAIDSRYNLMPKESFSMISDVLKASKDGKLEHLDLAGNNNFYELVDAVGILSELQADGRFVINLPSSAASTVPYDADP